MNRGQGGKVSQMESIGKKIRPDLEEQPPGRTKGSLMDIPNATLKNPMAPIPAKRGRPSKVSHSFASCLLFTGLVQKNKTVSTPQEASQTSGPPAPQFLVPPGTEPNLNGPPQPVLRKSTTASRFGFQK
jgi:hypothetical protein